MTATLLSEQPHRRLRHNDRAKKVGLSIGAVTPEGIALAIVSQIHGWLAGREGYT